MFRKNTNHQQSNLLGFELLLGEKKKSNINDSKYAYFYELIFCNIDEGKFASLYSAKMKISKSKYSLTFDEIITTHPHAPHHL